jgi:phenylacetaldehyde dehydrogenase
MRVVREEIFGPVVVAQPFKSIDEIAASANDTPYGLGAGIWTKDISKAHALAAKIRAGTVWINCYNVFDDAGDDAIQGAANAIFFNHGQCCVAGSRLFVQQSRFDEVVDGVAAIAKSIKMGPGMEPGTQMGPLVSDEQFRRVTGFLESGKSDGATALAGGGRFGDKGYFVEPTVLTNTRPDMKVVREEIFGPVLVASPFTDLEEIARVANDSEYGLGAGIWTKDISKAHALAKKLRAGTVWINCYNVFDAALPFGGYKQSGWGREMGHEVLNNYTEVKAVTTQL